ncbi:MAG: prepilin peptidase [Leifsonia sp.]
MIIAIAIGLGIVGLMIGSFLNVVIYRVPAGLSVVLPPSACPRCGASIKPYDNVPVISWLILRGRCRECAQPISVRYPLVEGMTGATFFIVGLFALEALGRTTDLAQLFSTVIVALAYLYLAAISVALAMIDLDTQRLPDSIVLPSYFVSLSLFIAAAFTSGDFGGLFRAVIMLAVLVVAYYVMAIAYPGGMGFGDVKLAGLLGLYLGWLGWGVSFVGALAPFVLGGLFGIALIVVRRANRKSGIPFGPWMLGGTWLAIAFGGPLFERYLALFGLA